MKNGRKLFTYLLSVALVIAGIVGLTSCDIPFLGGSDDTCEHEWADATCTNAKHCTKCDATEGEPIAHNWADATCAAPKTCKGCGATDGEKLAHTGGKATCQSAAICENCGSAYGEKAEHNWMGASCTAPRSCALCGATDGKELGHTGGSATCKETAVCDRCGSHYGEKADHDFAEATCTEAKKCNVCGETEGDSLGHTGGVATCKNEAVCDRCGKSYGEKVDHKYTEKVIELVFRASLATCEAPATYYYSCACGAIGEDTFEDGEALGHDYRYVHTDDGAHVKYCANETDVTGGVTEKCSGGKATCTDKAECEFCGSEYGEALGHSWDDGDTTNATCIADGKTVYTCSSCSETKSDVIKAEGHKYSAGKVVDPGCSTAGYTVYVCSGCGDSYNSDTVAAKGHSWSGERTCESGRECSTCGTKEDALGHNYGLTVTPATCTAAAVNKYVCSVCNGSYTETVGAPLGHSTVGVTPSKKVLNTCEYIEIFVCAHKDCDAEIEGEVISEHTYVASITKAATCTTAGEKTLVCSKCSNTKTETISANETGHAWVEGTVVGSERTDTCKHCSATKTVTVYTGNTTDATNASDLKDKEIQLDNANIKLDDGVVDAIGDKKVTVSADIATDADIADLEIDPEKLAQVGNNPIYNFTISDGDGNISQFGEGNFVTITLPYTLEDGEDVDSIAVWFINDKGELESIKATYNNGYVTFKTNHFSYYTVTRLTPEERCDLYGHNMKTSVVEGDCLTDGYVFELCVRCHVSNKTVTSVADGHNYSENEIPATCTTDGSATYTCVDCGHSYTVKLNKTGHFVKEIKRVEATCDEDGYIVLLCQNEGCDHEITKIIPMTGHVYTVNVIDATCETAGYTLYDCDNCDYYYTDNVVAAFGHSYKYSFDWSEDHTEAKIVFVCENDSDHTFGKDANVTIKTKAATCQEEGEVVYTAKVVYNGETYTDVYVETISKIDHGDDFRWMSNSHEHWKKCDCGNRIGVEDHVFNDFIIVEEPTCKREGEIVYICSSGCGWTKKDKLPKIDHTYVETSRTEATCIDDGEIKKTCTGCKNETTETIPATGEHNYVVTDSKDATCALDGYITKTCSGCGATVTETIPATGEHNYSVTDSKDATCGLDGYITETCSGCGATETKTIPATGEHNYSVTDHKEATCALAGYITTSCTGCGDTVTENLPATGKHNYSVTDSKEATCGVDGYVIETCSECGHEKTKNIPATGNHEYDDKGICSGCGRFEGDCDHTTLNKVTVDMSEMGCCNGTFVFKVCPCGERVIFDDEPDIDCDIDTIEENVTENADGSMEGYMTGLCSECGLYITAEVYMMDGEGCGYYERYSYSLYKADGSVIVENAVMEYNGANHNSEHVVIDLTDYGICGGMMEAWKCRDCGEIYHVNNIQPDCKNLSAEESYYTDEDGNLHTVQTIKCLDCGLYVEGDMYTEIRSVCESVMYVNISIYCNDKFICEYEYIEYDNTHEYETEYIPNGESCEDGYTVKEHCSKCGDTHQYTTFGHMLEEVIINLADFGFCGGYIRQNACKTCGVVLSAWVEGDCCTWTYQSDMGATLPGYDATLPGYGTALPGYGTIVGPGGSISGGSISGGIVSGGLGSSYVVCSKCGGAKSTEVENIYGDDTCSYTRKTMTVYLMNGMEVFSYEMSSVFYTHEYEYTYELEGDTCDDGVKMYGVCKVCGESTNGYTYGHNYVNEEINLADYGLCGGYVTKNCCTICGETGRFVIDDYGCAWMYVNGSDEYNYYVCQNCGAEKYVYISYGEKTENCIVSELYVYQYVVKGVTVLEFEISYRNAIHDYDKEIFMNGANCDEGGYIRYTCKDCGSSYKNYFSGHYTKEQVVDFSGFGMCGGYAYIYVCEACGEVIDSNVFDGYCSWNHKETTADGVEIYECINCGTLKHQYRVLDEKNEYCYCNVEVYFAYYKDGKEIGNYAVEKYYQQVHDYELTVENLGVGCEDGIRYTYTCRDCGYSYTDETYYHDTEYKYVSLSDFGMCGGYAYMYVCKVCDRITSSYVNHYSCVWENKGMTDDGKELSICMNCNAEKYVFFESLAKDENCVKITKTYYEYFKDGVLVYHHENWMIYTEHNNVVTSFTMNGVTCGDGINATLACRDCGHSYDQYFGGHYTKEEYVDFSSFGMCEGYTRMYVCQFCGEISPSSSYWENCSWIEKESIDGVTVYECSTCGAVKREWNETTEKDANCKYKQIYHKVYSKGGEEVSHFKTIHNYTDHTYEYMFEMNGATCEEGGKVIIICRDCGYSYEDMFSGHYTTEKYVYPSDLGMCSGNGSYYYMGICLCCNEVMYGYAYSVDCNWKRIETTDEGVAIYECMNCGTVRHYWTEITEKDATCGFKYIYHTVYFVDGVEVYHHQSVSNNTQHEYEYTFKMNGTTCADGGIVTLTCRDCGYSYEETFSGHYSVEKYVELSDFGMCGGYAYMYVCRCCGEITSGYRGDYSCNWTHKGTTDDGVETYECVNCGAVKNYWTVVTEKDAECRFKRIYHNVYYIDGVEVYHHQNVNYDTNHVYSYSFEMSGTSCTDGVKITYTCSDCGYTYERNINHHETFVKEKYDLTKYGACSGTYNVYSCACGENMSVGMSNVCYNNYNDTSYLDADGVLHNVIVRSCSTCGFRYQSDYYTLRDSATCKSVTYDSVSVVVKDTPVTLTKYTTKQDSHDYKATAKYMDGAENCDGGVIITYTCKDCSATYTTNTYGHYEFEINRYNLADYGAECKGYLVEKSCLCGYAHRISLNEALCNFDQKSCECWIESALNAHYSYPYFYYYRNAWIYTCAVTDPQCAFKIRKAEYALKVDGKCAAQWYQTWQIGYNPETDTCLFEITFTYDYERVYHAYEYTSTSVKTDDNNRYEQSTHECPDCGTYYRETWFYTTKDGYTWNNKYELIYENKLNNGAEKSIYRISEYEYHKYSDGGYTTYETRDYNKSVRADGSVYEYQYLYEYDYDYVAPFGERSYIRTTTFTSTDSNGWKREAAYTVYKGHSFVIYSYEINNYGSDDEYWERYDYTYDFTNGCMRSCIYTDSSGARIEYGFESWHQSSQYVIVQDSTCTQYGVYAYRCYICDHNTSEGMIEPKAHKWFKLGDSHYTCAYCGLENANGASGEVVIEDLTSKYGNDEYYVLGYWNRGSVEFTYYVSLLFADGYDEFIDVEIIEMDGITAFAVSKAAVAEMAKAMGFEEGTYNVMFTFVPYGADGKDDYAIVFTEEVEAEEITDTAGIIKFVGIGEIVTIKITPTEDGVWTFTSDAAPGYTGSKDTYAYLYDENGNLLRSDDDGAGDLQFLITYTLEAGKTYELRVKWLGSDNFGNIFVYATKA